MTHSYATCSFVSTRASALIVVASLLLISCSAIDFRPAGDQSACTPSFPLKDGWLGGDAAYSIALSETASLWFFGDTFIGKEGASDRHGADFIANSVARSACTNGDWSISYTWRVEKGETAPIFSPNSSAYKYWPLSSFWHEGQLHILLVRVESLGNGNALSFRTVGVDLAHIANPFDPPATWQITFSRVYSGTDLIPGVASIVDGDYLLIYATLEGDRFRKSADYHSIILGRVPLHQIGKRPMSFETLGKDGAWISGLNVENGARIMTGGATEMSLRPLQSGEEWLAVMPAVEPLASYAVTRRAPTPDGPWDAGEKLIDYSEQIAAAAQGDQNVFCYAAKEHGQFARSSRRLLITYVCNTLDDAVLDRMDLYAPVVKRVTLSRDKGGNGLARFFNTLF